MKLSPEEHWFDTVDRQIRLRHSSVVVFTACDFDATMLQTRRFRTCVPRKEILILVPTTVRKGFSVYTVLASICISYKQDLTQGSSVRWLVTDGCTYSRLPALKITSLTYDAV
jgi:hypothetical protein